jgi:hypothetical protein
VIEGGITFEHEAVEATMEPPVTERGSSGGEKCR